MKRFGVGYVYLVPKLLLRKVPDAQAGKPVPPDFSLFWSEPTAHARLLRKVPQPTPSPPTGERAGVRGETFPGLWVSRRLIFNCLGTRRIVILSEAKNLVISIA
jgi:hypothetical protein